MHDNQSELFTLLTDLIKMNAIIGTELIQLVENSSRQIHGEIPESCKVQHTALKKEMIEIAEKWNPDCNLLKVHNLEHE